MNTQQQYCSCNADNFSCQANRFCDPELDDGNNPICVKDKPGCSMCNDYFDYKDNSNLPFCNYSLPQADHGCLRDEDGGINKDLYFDVNEYHKDLDKCLLMDNSRTTNKCVEKLYQEFGKPFTDNKAFGTASEKDIQTIRQKIFQIAENGTVTGFKPEFQVCTQSEYDKEKFDSYFKLIYPDKNYGNCTCLHYKSNSNPNQRCESDKVALNSCDHMKLGFPCYYPRPDSRNFAHASLFFNPSKCSKQTRENCGYIVDDRDVISWNSCKWVPNKEPIDLYNNNSNIFHPPSPSPPPPPPPPPPSRTCVHACLYNNNPIQYCPDGSACSQSLCCDNHM
jgi:hypothetical protein